MIPLLNRPLSVASAAALASALVVALHAAPVSAQDGRGILAGQVVDEAAVTVVTGADVILVGTGRTITTDGFGTFEFRGLTPGEYVIEVRHPGYAVHSDTVSVDADERLDVRFALGADAIPLEPISVIARSRTTDIERTEGRRFDGMSRAEIEEVLPRVFSMADLIMATNTPGVSALPRGSWVCLEHSRISRNRRDTNGVEFCRPMAVYVDGVRSLIPTEVLLDLQPSDIERFEILSPLAATTYYGSQGAEGVLVVETVRGGRSLGEPVERFTYDQSKLNISFSLMGSNPSSLHDGPVVVTVPQGTTSAFYREKSSWRPGARVAMGYRFGGLREMRMSLYGASGSSTGSYSSIRRFGSTLVQERGLASAGADLGIRLRMRGSERWDLRFEIGPTLAWQRLRLSEGHQDEWASPATVDDVDINWSDRDWWSLGLLIGADWSLILDNHWAVFTGVRLRALYYGDAQSWEFQEITDIYEQTGNVVFLTYSHPVALHPSIDVGLTWRR